MSAKHGRRIALIGSGYVGLPVAVAFARAGETVIGFDIDPARLNELRKGLDRTREIPAAELASAKLQLTDDPVVLRGADFFIVTVPRRSIRRAGQIWPP
jgi:UDP-N-acetyl-D-galactosamine dehydrogenase